jgi:hypothetical protein
MPGRKTRSFGSIRKLPSGRWQARYRAPDGLLRSAPHTFARKADASRWLGTHRSGAAERRMDRPGSRACPVLGLRGNVD